VATRQRSPAVTDGCLDAVSSEIQLHERRESTQVLDVFDTVAGEVQDAKISQVLETFHHTDLPPNTHLTMIQEDCWVNMSDELTDESSKIY